VAILECLLVPFAQRHHRGHVDLVEGAEHGGGALRFDEAFGDRRPPLRHAHALFAAIALGTAAIFGDGRHGLRFRGRGRWRLCGRRSDLGGWLGRTRGALDVAAHDTASIAAAAHL
jgi:hypothetical protein